MVHAVGLDEHVERVRQCCKPRRARIVAMLLAWAPEALPERTLAVAHACMTRNPDAVRAILAAHGRRAGFRRSKSQRSTSAWPSSSCSWQPGPTRTAAAR